MKTQSTSLFNNISKTQLIRLTTEVKETIAMDVTVSAGKKFTVADVWNIQRNKRVRVQRRFVL